MAIDPVCGMDVEESEDSLKMEYKGTVFYFCSKACLISFSKDPEKFLPKESGDTSQNQT